MFGLDSGSTYAYFITELFRQLAFLNVDSSIGGLIQFFLSNPLVCICIYCLIFLWVVRLFKALTSIFN